MSHYHNRQQSGRNVHHLLPTHRFDPITAEACRQCDVPYGALDSEYGGERTYEMALMGRHDCFVDPAELALERNIERAARFALDPEQKRLWEERQRRDRQLLGE